MLLKDANVPFEDERYSYVVVTREKVASGARILAPPLESKPGLTFKLCDETGLRAQFVASRDTGSGDWTFVWVRRTRIGGVWSSGGGAIPLGETAEAYELAIPTSGGAKATATASRCRLWRAIWE